MAANSLNELMEQLKEYCLTYAEEHGVELNSNGFVKCLNPEHADNNPSMSWWESQNVFHCFACGKVMDIFDLANLFEGKPLAGRLFLDDNVFYLARKYGIPYEHLQRDLTPEDLIKASYYRIMKLFSDYIVKNANKSYLESRNINIKTAAKLKIGSIDNFQNLINYLIANGASIENIKELGINPMSVNDKKLIFIIKDKIGREVSFVSRHMIKEDVENKISPKYINGKKTVIFNKSETFFGWSDIKKSYNSLSKLMIVEGYMDFVTAYQKGFTNIVALGSASFTQEHIHFIEKEQKIKTVAIALDNDKVGKERMGNIVDLLKEMKTSKEYNFAVYKEGVSKDLDEIINSQENKIKLGDYFETMSLFEYSLNMVKHMDEEVDESVLFDRFVGIISKTEQPKKREEQARILAKSLENYSYNTILQEIDYIISDEKAKYKQEIAKIIDASLSYMKENPDSIMGTLEDIKEDVENINKKFNKISENVFEKGVKNIDMFEKNKQNKELNRIEFHIPWLDDLPLNLGHSFLLSAGPGSGKTTFYQLIMKSIITSENNGVLFYISTDDSAEMIYNNLISSISGLPRNYCNNPYYDPKYGIDNNNTQKAKDLFEKYNSTLTYVKKLIESGKFVVFDVKDAIDDWEKLRKTMLEISNYPGMDNKFKIMIVDSVNKITVPGISDENKAISFLSSNIKKTSENLKILSFLNFELNKTKDNKKLNSYDLGGSKRMFYDSSVLGFIYNPTRNLQEFKGTSEETELQWGFHIGGQTIKQPVLFTIQYKSKVGNVENDSVPYFYKLNTIFNQLTPVDPHSNEHKELYKIWSDEWANKYVSGYDKK